MVKLEPIVKRGCGFRKVGGFYLVGAGLTHLCERLPLKIPSCPCCGERPRPNRGIQKFDYGKYFGTDEYSNCPPNCWVCYPDTIIDMEQYLMWVGKRYYNPDSFINEAEMHGVSKRISRKMIDHISIGTSVIFLAYQSMISDNHDKRIKHDAIFYAFIPTAIEHLMTESEYRDLPEEEEEEMKERGIRIVVVPNNYKSITDNYEEYKKSEKNILGEFFNGK